MDHLRRDFAIESGVSLSAAGRNDNRANNSKAVVYCVLTDL